VCVGYKLHGEIIETFPSVSQDLDQIEPIYETLEGWKSETLGITKLEDLPVKAREYVDFLSNSIGVEIGLVSTGPERDQTIIVKDSVMENWLK
jgi:adenylosuccinate synthase